MKSAHQLLALIQACNALTSASAQGLWSVYNNALKDAKYVDLTHAFHPTQAV